MTLALGQYCCWDCGGQLITNGYEQFTPENYEEGYDCCGVISACEVIIILHSVNISIFAVADEIAIGFGNSINLYNLIL